MRCRAVLVAGLTLPGLAACGFDSAGGGSGAEESTSEAEETDGDEGEETSGADSDSMGDDGETSDGDATTEDGSTTSDGDTGEDTSTDDDTTDGGTDTGGEGLLWEPCPLYTYGSGSDAECTTIDVPLDWDDPSGPDIELFVKRIGEGSGRDLWMLMGGPGGASHGFEAMADTLTSNDPNLQVYLLDHRGVGRSTRLGCSAEGAGTPGGLTIEPSELEECVDDLVATWGEDLAHFSTTGAARDLGWLIDETSMGDAVHVFGSSYGTFWAHRYLQIFPDQPEAVTLLGVTVPSFTFTVYDENFDEAGRAYLELCNADPLCSSKVGPDAGAFIDGVFDQLDQGHCPEAQAAGITRETLRVWFGANLLWSWNERVMAPAVAYRLQRCNAQDIAAMQTLGPQIQDPLGGLLNDSLFSRVINHHIKMSELWEAPLPTIEDLEAIQDQAIFNLGSSHTGVLLEDLWPAYPEDEYADVWHDSDVPLLVINGQFDPATPVSTAMEWAGHVDAPGQRYVEIPFAGHSWGSPMPEYGGADCITNMFFAFMQDPLETIWDCRPDIEPVTFSGHANLAQNYFGTNDLWE